MYVSIMLLFLYFTNKKILLELFNILSICLLKIINNTYKNNELDSSFLCKTADNNKIQFHQDIQNPLET